MYGGWGVIEGGDGQCREMGVRGLGCYLVLLPMFKVLLGIQYISLINVEIESPTHLPPVTFCISGKAFIAASAVTCTSTLYVGGGGGLVKQGIWGSGLGGCWVLLTSSDILYIRERLLCSIRRDTHFQLRHFEFLVFLHKGPLECPAVHEAEGHCLVFRGVCTTIARSSGIDWYIYHRTADGLKKIKPLYVNIIVTPFYMTPPPPTGVYATVACSNSVEWHVNHRTARSLDKIKASLC